MADPAHHAGTTGAQGRADSASGAVVAEAAAAPEDASVLAALRVLARDAWSLVHDHLLLATLEAQRAGRSLTRMIIAGIFAAILLVTSWLALVAAVVFWWVDSGASWPQAFVAMAVLNIAVGVGMMLWIRRLAADLLFPATLRTLRPGSAPEPSAGTRATTHPVP